MLINKVSVSSIIPLQYLDPIPGATYVNKETSIIIKPYFLPAKSSINDKNIISVNASKSGVHNGNLILSSDGQVIIFKPFSRFELGDTVFVKLSSKLTNNSYVYNYYFVIKSREPNINIKTSIETELANYFSQNRPILKNNIMSGDSLPSDFPSITIDNSLAPSSGVIFLDNYPGGTYSPYLMILDNTGSLIYYQKTTYTSFDFKVQPNGLLTYYSYDGQKFYAMNGYFQIVDSFYTGNNYYTDVHELRVLSDGSAYLLSCDPEIVNMSKIVTGGDTAAIVTGLIVQQIDSNKNVIFQWRSWDHFQITDATHENLLAHSIDYVHGNAIEIDNDENIIISSRHLDEITKINRSNGNIIWRLGGKNNQFTFLNDSIGFSHQHAIRRLSNGNITLFDNGNYHNPSFSRAVEYTLDEQGKTATVVWQYRNNPIIYGSAMGYVQRLDNGNTFICWGATNPTVTEVTESDSKVFQLSFPSGIIGYRGYRMNWSPTVPVLRYPENASLNMSLTSKLFWFKMPNAISYELQISTDSVFSNIILDTINLTATNIIIKPGILSSDIKYYWRVNSSQLAETTPWSFVWNFTTKQNLSVNLKLYLEGFWNGSSHITDTIRVYLASSTSPFIYKDSTIVILSSGGNAVPTFSKTGNGDYYIVVKHRNHLETWSKQPQLFTSGMSVNYDFTSSASQAYGNNMKQFGNAWVFIGGDVNLDGSIDAMDIAMFITQFGNTGSYLSCDFNGDGSVDAMDVQIIASNFGLTKAVPYSDMSGIRGNKDRIEQNKIKDNKLSKPNFQTDRNSKKNRK